MNLLRNRIFRLPTIAIGALAWLAVTNHCTIAAMESAARMPMATCHDTAPAEQAPQKHDQPGRVECCKVLRATLLTLSSNLTAYDTLAFAPHDYVVPLVSAFGEPRLTDVIEWDTGPPGADSFAESVLQRSILAHAPPVLA